VALLVKNDESKQAAEAVTTKTGLVYTFYSFKGGVGRSMALANVAALLAQWGRKVLILDWDLEAPGIEKFFEVKPLRISGSREMTSGIVDLLLSQMQSKPLSWRDCLLKVDLNESSREEPQGKLHIISAGKLVIEGKRDYIARLREVNWDQLFDEHDLGMKIDTWRSEWLREYDFVLVDSRTGISDAGSICTILLPDVLVLVFTTSYQSIDGIRDVMERARAAHSQLPVARARLTAVPLLSRDGRKEESDTAKKWRATIADRLGELYKDWLPTGVTPEDVLLTLYIPQLAYWSFGERLPVIEKREEARDAASIVAAYTKLGRLLETELDWTSVAGSTVIPSEVAQRVKEQLQDIEVQRQEVKKRAEELRGLDQKRKWWVSHLAFGFAVLFVVGPLVALSAVRPSWLGDLLSGRVGAALFAILGSAFAQLGETLRRIDEQSVPPAQPVWFTLAINTVLTMLCGGIAAILPGAETASGSSGLIWAFVGIAIYLLLSNRVLKLTKPSPRSELQ
jgi:Mrp family chromosome partitioning ATPase